MQSALAPQAAIGPARYPRVISGDAMRARDFWIMIDTDDELEIVRCHEGECSDDDYVEIRFTVTGGRTQLKVSEISRHDADDLRDLLKFRRSPRVISHHPSRSARGWLPERIAS